MAKSIELNIEPRVLAWARESIGFSPQQVASRLKSFRVDTDDVLDWETGEAKPRLTIVERLALLYKRPLVVFYLPAPPKEPPFPKDFRMLPDDSKSPFSEKTRLAVRRVWRIQSLAKELARNINRQVRPDIAQISLSDDPEKVAAKLRHHLKIDLATQFQWHSEYDAFYSWQQVIENLGVLVLQAPLRTKEALGFSIFDAQFPAIIVSSKDWINRRIFTLFHELAHLLLRNTGVCEWDHDDKNISEDTKKVEVFCNHFAGAVLAPKDALLSNPAVQSIKTESDLTEDLLRKLSIRFRISTEAMLRRLVILDVVSGTSYQRKRKEWQEKFGDLEQKGGRTTPAEKCLRQSGRPFVSLILENRNQGKITLRDVADYLELKTKHFSSVEQLLRFRR